MSSATADGFAAPRFRFGQQEVPGPIEIGMSGTNPEPYRFCRGGRTTGFFLSLKARRPVLGQHQWKGKWERTYDFGTQHAKWSGSG